MGQAEKDLGKLPEAVQEVFLHALEQAKHGLTHPDAKPLSGFGGGKVLEVVERHDTDAYREVYTVRFSDAVYVLHVFQKKSKTGVRTPKPDIEKVKIRLKDAEAHHKALAEQEAKPRKRRKGKKK